MGILNAIFAPFIVLYLLMYSFFRYFEVGDVSKIMETKVQCFLFLLFVSNIIRTHRPSVVDDTPPLLAGSFGNLTNYHTYLPDVWTKVIL